ncbi:MAG: hypothetical protein H0V73_02725 [Chloroflexi bacterium]|nr:hypothetical protein [Chloroflexota bacterium]
MTNRPIAQARLRNSRLVGPGLASAEDLILETHVLLLPNYDEALGSYRDYSPVMDDALPRAHGVNDVLGAHIVVRMASSSAAGGERSCATPVIVTVTLLIPLTPAELDALEVAAAAFARFLGLPVELRVGVAALT